MRLHVLDERRRASFAAADLGASYLRAALQRDGEATLVLAASLAQVDVLARLRCLPEIEWGRVSVFHLDEYVGLPETHRASCRRFVLDHFVDRIPGLREFVPVDGEAECREEERARLAAALAGRPVHVCFAGIGENGHVAFNDPPADFTTREPYVEVALDALSRRQLVAEGWFATEAQVPDRALTMSIFQIMRSERLVLAVLGRRKRDPLRAAIAGPLDPRCPASVLRLHPSCDLFADADAMGEDEDWLGYAALARDAASRTPPRRTS